MGIISKAVIRTKFLVDYQVLLMIGFGTMLGSSNPRVSTLAWRESMLILWIKGLVNHSDANYNFKKYVS